MPTQITTFLTYFCHIIQRNNTRWSANSPHWKNNREIVWRSLGFREVLGLSLALHLCCELLDLLYCRSNTIPIPHTKAKRGPESRGLLPPVSFIFSSRHSVGSILSRQTDGWSSLHSTYLHEIYSPDSILFFVISHLSEQSHVPFIFTQSNLMHFSISPTQKL